MGWWETSIGGSLLVLSGWIVRRLTRPAGGSGLFDLLASPFVVGILRKRIAEQDETIVDATESVDRARSEVIYWKDAAEYWRGRCAELESAPPQRRSTSTARQKPRSSP